MFTSFITIAWRNLTRNKVYSLINIFGLSLGLASAIIILMSVDNELSYDLFHKKKDVLYMAWNRDLVDGEIKCWATTCTPLAPALKKEFPEVREVARSQFSSLSLFSYKEKAVRAIGTAVDPSFLTMFTFPLVKGNALTALNDASDIIVTESFAKRLFGSEDPMNKTVLFNNRDAFTVTGVMKDLPDNTSFQFEYLLPWAYQEKIHEDYPWWGSNSIQTFVELQPGASIDQVNNKIKGIVHEHQSESTDEVFLHPITKWWLYSGFENGKNTGGRITYVRMVTIIALFVLLIACINFMNLSTARSEKRAREVGIRKVVGAERKTLIIQFLGESVFFAAIAFLFSLMVVQLALPGFNHLVGKELHIEYGNIYYWLTAVAIVLFTGLVAGSYPALYLSSFLPVKVLKNNISAARAAVTPRKALVVLQFIFSIALIICTIIVEQQLRYAQDRPSGYNKDNLVYHAGTGDLQKNYKLVKHDLLSSGVASDVFLTSRKITENGSNTWGLTWKGKAPNTNILFDRFDACDGFARPLQIPLVSGRDLDVDRFPTDTAACLINESALKVIGFKDPIGQFINSDSQDIRIVGVFKDFIWGSPYFPTHAMIIFGDDFAYSATSPNIATIINVRFNPAHSTADNLKNMERIFKKYNPAYPFEYHFVDEAYAYKFRAEQIMGKLAAASALLAIIISCLGLFGLAAFTAEQRTKEIGIRRVMGASVFNIVLLLSRDFLRLVLLSAIIAFPLSWWAMHAWLQNYPYRISIGIGVFLLSGIAAMFIALVTVSFQAIKAAKANPVKSLRSE